jgi:hypothetical protein
LQYSSQEERQEEKVLDVPLVHHAVVDSSAHRRERKGRDDKGRGKVGGAMGGVSD